MPLPSFTIDGVLPPFVGPDGPGGGAEDLSPYVVTALEMVRTLGKTPERRTILDGWLRHRAAMRAIGFDRGFQWLDGSFVEDKQPQDLDVVSFLYRPPGVRDRDALAAMMHANLDLFLRPRVREVYSLDSFSIDLDGSPEGLVGTSRYFLSLFSHRRGDNLWKGMLQVRLEDAADDDAALAALGAVAAAPERILQ